jgi:hypothetical protein
MRPERQPLMLQEEATLGRFGVQQAVVHSLGGQQQFAAEADAKAPSERGEGATERPAPCRQGN